MGAGGQFFYAGGSEQMRLTSTGLGIGTSSPTDRLQVEASLDAASGAFVRNTNTGSSASGSVSVASGVGSIVIRAHSAAHSIWPNQTLINSGSGFSGGLNIFQNGASPIKFWTDSSERMRLDASGNLGIGTSSPTTKLTVSGGAKIGTGAATNNATLMVNQPNGSATGIQLFQDGQESWIMEVPASSTALRWTASGTEQMRLTSAGNLGIGTSSPSAKLVIQQANNTSDGVRQFANGNDSQLITRYLSSIDAWQVTASFASTGGYKPITWFTSDLERMRLDSSGNLGLGVTPSGNYTLQGAANFAQGFKGALLGTVTIGASGSEYGSVGYNVRYTASSGSYLYNVGDTANMIRFSAGAFQFLQAASGTGGGAISFTQAMTLSAANNLLVGVTTDTASARAVVGGTVISTTNTVSTFSGDYAGFDRTSSKNMRIFSGTSNATGSSIEFHTGVSGSVTERMRLDSSGNLGLGVTPSASWSAGFKALQISGQGAGLSASTTISTIYLSSNGIYNGTNWQYGNSAAAGQYQIDTNAHKWFTAPSGTAGNAISFTQAMTLDASGRLMVGTTSPAGILTVVQNANSATAFTIVNSDTGLSAASRIYFDTAGGGNYIETRRNGGGLWFNVNASDRLNIDNAGNILNVSAGGLGYGTGSGGAVTQITSRTTGVTLNKTNGAITLVSAAGTATWQSFTVTNSTIAISDTVIVNQRSGTDLYMINVTAVAAGSFRISFATTGGTTTEQPVFNFAVIKAVTA
jgi:hypothetical protein